MRPSLRNFALWVVVVLLLLAVFTLFQNPRPRSVEAVIPFSELLDDVDLGRVRSVVIEGSEIRAAYIDGSSQKTYAPNDPNLVERLHHKGVVIEARPPAGQDSVPGFVSLILSWLPFIVMIGAWIVLSRSMQGVGIPGCGFGGGMAISASRDDPDRWRDRARESHAAADGLADPQSRRQMLEIARGYEYLAQRAEERVRGSDHP